VRHLLPGDSLITDTQLRAYPMSFLYSIIAFPPPPPPPIYGVMSLPRSRLDVFFSFFLFLVFFFFCVVLCVRASRPLLPPFQFSPLRCRSFFVWLTYFLLRLSVRCAKYFNLFSYIVAIPPIFPPPPPIAIGHPYPLMIIFPRFFLSRPPPRYQEAPPFLQRQRVSRAFLRVLPLNLNHKFLRVDEDLFSFSKKFLTLGLIRVLLYFKVSSLLKPWNRCFARSC